MEKRFTWAVLINAVKWRQMEHLHRVEVSASRTSRRVIIHKYIQFNLFISKFIIHLFNESKDVYNVERRMVEALLI